MLHPVRIVVMSRTRPIQAGYWFDFSVALLALACLAIVYIRHFAFVNHQTATVGC
jgi:hypothetical protein